VLFHGWDAKAALSYNASHPQSHGLLTLDYLDAYQDTEQNTQKDESGTPRNVRDRQVQLNAASTSLKAGTSSNMEQTDIPQTNVLSPNNRVPTPET
jgi:hypothetical protein